jgi:hypothetical protein
MLPSFYLLDTPTAKSHDFWDAKSLALVVQSISCSIKELDGRQSGCCEILTVIFLEAHELGDLDNTTKLWW